MERLIGMAIEAPAAAVLALPAIIGGRLSLFFGNFEEGAAEDGKREVLFLPCEESVPQFVNQLSSFVQLNYARVCASLRKLSKFAQKLDDYAVFTQ